MTRSRAPPPPKFKDFNRKQSRLGALCDRVTSFDVGALFAQARPLAQPRTIFINEPLPAEYFDKKGRVTKDHTYPTNQVITSKYTILIFLPRNLLEQFRRIANMCVNLHFAQCTKADNMTQPASSLASRSCNFSPSLLRPTPSCSSCRS